MWLCLCLCVWLRKKKDNGAAGGTFLGGGGGVDRSVSLPALRLLFLSVLSALIISSLLFLLPLLCPLFFVVLFIFPFCFALFSAFSLFFSASCDCLFFLSAVQVFSSVYFFLSHIPHFFPVSSPVIFINSVSSLPFLLRNVLFCFVFCFLGGRRIHPWDRCGRRAEGRPESRPRRSAVNWPVCKFLYTRIRTRPLAYTRAFIRACIHIRTRVLNT